MLAFLHNYGCVLILAGRCLPYHENLVDGKYANMLGKRRVRLTHQTIWSIKPMPEYRRAKREGGTYFFTVNTYHRQPILTDMLIRQALREGIDQARQTLPFKIEAWVLLPDHLHCIWTLPPDDANFSARWAIIKRHVSKCCTTHRIGAWDAPYASRRIRKESGIWQQRFWEHLIRNDVDLRRHVDYIHWNPVKHGHVRKVQDWPYSTFHRFVKNGFYPPDWGGDGIDVIDDACFGE